MLRSFVRRHWKTAASLLLILALSALFRLWGIGSAPPALHGDEAVNGMDALDLLAGRGSVFFPNYYGREGLNMVFIAALFKMLGVSAIAIRLSSAIGGILVPPAVYWLGRELFLAENREGKLRCVPLLAATWVATAYWAVSFSRFGERGSYTILCGALTFASFWRGVNRSRDGSPSLGITVLRACSRPAWAWFLLSGFFLGLSTHFYSISRLYPVFLGIFLAVQAAVARARPGGKAWARGSLLHTYWKPILGLFTVAALVFAPLGWYFLAHPGTFTSRAGAVSAFGNQADPWAAVARSVVGNVAQFFLPGHGDTKPAYNLPGRAVLEPLTALLALLGYLICLRRGRRPHYLLLLLWWPIMLLPAFLATDRIPTSWRVMGAMPALYFFPAVVLGMGVDWLAARRLVVPLRRGLAAALLVVPLTLASVSTVLDYRTWATLPGTYRAFDSDVVEAARWLKANPQPWPVYVSADLYRHLSFLFEYSQVPTSQFYTYRDGVVRWFDARTVLPLPPEDRDAVYLFPASAQPADEWLDRYLPDREILYQSYTPSGDLDFTVIRAAYHDRREVLAEAVLAGGVSLAGYGVYGHAQPGATLQVALHWRLDGPRTEWQSGLRARVTLLDGQGQEWGTVEQALDYRPEEWDENSRAVSWHEMRLPAEAPKAAYRLAIRLVDANSGQPLGDRACFSFVEDVAKPLQSPLATFGGALRLLEATIRAEAVPGGDQLVAGLVFDTMEPLPLSYTLFLQALDASGRKVGQVDTAAGGGLFPTDAWLPGGAHREVYRVFVDPAGASGTCRLALGFYDWRTGERLPAAGPDGERLPDDQLLLEMP